MGVENKTLFISHTKSDYESVGLEIIVKELQLRGFDVFCSSNPNVGIDAGKKLHEEMNYQLRRCTFFLAIVTENYLRSPHCIYEMSVIRFLKKKKPIIIYESEDIISRLSDIADSEWISINLSANYDAQQYVDASLILAKTLRINKQECDFLVPFLKEVSIIKPSYRPYVGMSKNTYRDILYYCQKEGITKIGNGSIYTKDEMISKFAKAKTIYILSTTGASLLKSLKEEALIKALGNRAQINIILPDRDSLFCQDVAQAECERSGYNSVIAEQNRYRIESEFVATIQYLNEAYCSAREQYGRQIGKICCYDSKTLLRQTIVLVISDDNRSWGWINMTMPPLRTTDTPSIAINDSSIQKGLDAAIMNHCQSIMRNAKNRNALRIINGRSSANKLMANCYEEYWRNKKLKAESLMQKRKEQSSNVLIEIAAQHPLKKGLFPNEEFQKRLDVAIQVGKEIGIDNVWFYVPGSRHQYNGVVDKISLSEAGRNYLINQGIEKTRIYSDEANIKYKGEQGVYNSADESFVASQLFVDDNFGRLICVCSPYQIMRKTFYYYEFGVVPECYGVPNDKMFHDPISEYFGSLHYTVYEDQNWQSDKSKAANESRKERMA